MRAHSPPTSLSPRRLNSSRHRSSSPVRLGTPSKTSTPTARKCFPLCIKLAYFFLFFISSNFFALFTLICFFLRFTRSSCLGRWCLWSYIGENSVQNNSIFVLKIFWVQARNKQYHRKQSILMLCYSLVPFITLYIHTLFRMIEYPCYTGNIVQQCKRSSISSLPFTHSASSIYNEHLFHIFMQIPLPTVATGGQILHYDPVYGSDPSQRRNQRDSDDSQTIFHYQYIPIN